MRNRLALAACLLGFVAIAIASAAAISQFQVVTWGENSPEWNRLLHRTGARIGCSDAVQSCLQEADQIAASQRVSTVMLAVLLKPERILTDAAAYAKASSAHRELVEVGFDDFVGQAEKTKLDGAQLSALLENIAAYLRQGKSEIEMGITLYQDEMTDGQLGRLGMDDAARKAVEIVHLYPHYRKDAKPLAEYVALAKQTFPNAKILLGDYAYDRRQYLPCAKGNRTPCSDDEELALFENNLQEDLRMAKSGEVAGIEFFPGQFGNEDSWDGWNDPRACKQGERGHCVQITQTMRTKIKEEISNDGRQSK